MPHVTQKPSYQELEQRVKELENGLDEHKRVEETLLYRAKLEALVSYISTSFINIPSERMDAFINLSLHLLGEFAKVDRSYVFLFSDDGTMMDNTHEWCHPGIKPQIQRLQRLSTEIFPWWMLKLGNREPIHVNKVDRLPPETRAEKEILQSQDIQSVLVVPLEYKDELVGFMGFDSVKKEKLWIEEDILLLKTIGDVFVSALKRKEVEEILARRLEFERLISEISSRFVGLSSENINEGVDHALASIGAFSGADRAYAFLFHQDGKRIDKTHEWCAEGIQPQIKGLKNIPIHEKLPWFAEQIKNNEVFQMPEVALMPPEARLEKEHLAAQQIKSLMILPMRLKNQPIGFIGFDAVRARRTWTDSEQALLRIVGEIITNALDRRQAEARLRESEEKLARSGKMESLGLLAGGVAHDLNNVLSGIVSYPELLLLNLPEDSQFRKPIETIKESGHRAVAIVKDLLTIARGAASIKEPLNLNDIIRDYLGSPEYHKMELLHPMVKFKTDFAADLLNINGSPIHVRKVVMNLIINASEAIENTGQIIISTRNCYVDRPLRKFEDVNTGEYVVLTVSDDGLGIPPDYLDKIFEPFFTKKVMGRSGTGLGLAVVWNIMQDHHGYLDLDSNENGTTFELYFPITRDEVIPANLPLSLADLMGDGETVLVVDDEETQREISCAILDTLGYKSQSVASGEEAVQYLKEHSVDLILLDMIMEPGISGRETYERIKEIHPPPKAIIVSGFAETAEVKEAQRLGAGPFIRKPLTLEKIGLAIRNELGKQVRIL